MRSRVSLRYSTRLLHGPLLAVYYLYVYKMALNLTDSLVMAVLPSLGNKCDLLTARPCDIILILHLTRSQMSPDQIDQLFLPEAGVNRRPVQSDLSYDMIDLARGGECGKHVRLLHKVSIHSKEGGGVAATGCDLGCSPCLCVLPRGPSEFWLHRPNVWQVRLGVGDFDVQKIPVKYLNFYLHLQSWKKNVYFETIDQQEILMC